MTRTSITVGVLTLLLLVTVPAGAAPSLQKGNQASYNLSASISFFQSCRNIGVSISSNMIMCPMIATIPSAVDISGTLGWTATDVNSTTASLNVTRHLTTSYGDSSILVTHTSGSFNESINLATRIVSLLPILMPEMEQALQMAQSSMATGLPMGVKWSSMSMLNDAMTHRPLYTMWWVNGPLNLNQTIPVLFLPTNVTGTTKVDIGSTIGTRSAWTLAFNLSRSLPLPDPLATSPSSIFLGDNLELAFTFNYDQTSDLLLSATADIHLGFGLETAIQPIPCDASVSSRPCPASSGSITIMRAFGIDVQASLKLASTTVDLNHRMTLTGSSQNGNNGSQNTGTGSGSGPGTGTGGDPGLGTSGSTSGTGQTTSNPAQPKSSLQSAIWLPWIYGLLGIVGAAIIGAGVWLARRPMKRTASDTPTIQPSV